MTGSCESWGFSSAHIRGTHVPVEEPSTASGRQVGLERPGIVPVISKLIAAGAAEHLRVRLDLQAGGLDRPLDHPGKAGD
jgi:hypothetical protein